MSFPFYWSIGIVLVLCAWIYLISRSASRLRRCIQCYEEQVRTARNQQFELRAQKHDFLNHINTIHALVHMKEYSELRDYTERWAHEVSDAFDKHELGHPVLTALIQTKQTEAEKRGVLLTSQFDNWRLLPSQLSVVELVRIFGNLIDNAIEFTAERRHEDRWVRVHGDMADGKLLIKVMNPGRLPKTISSNILKPGYTTKNDHGGIGLSIVQEIAAKSGGNVKFHNKGDKITFKFEIPLL